METIEAKLRSDKRKTPAVGTYNVLDFEAIKQIKSGDRISVLDQAGNVAQVKVTSIKVWKRRPTDMLINYKYGLYEFGYVTVTAGKPDITIVSPAA